MVVFKYVLLSSVNFLYFQLKVKYICSTFKNPTYEKANIFHVLCNAHIILEGLDGS